MRTRVLRRDRRKSPLCKSARERGIVGHVTQTRAHLRSVTSDEEILAGREQPFDIIPWRRDQRDSTRERLEDANCRNAGKRLDVGTPRYVYGGPIPCEHVRRFIVRKPPAILEA